MVKTGRPKSYDHEAILALYDQGLKLQEIADRVGCSVGGVATVVYKTDRSPWNHRYPNIAEVNEAQLLADYQSGMELTHILEKHKISQNTLYRRLRKAEIPLRPRPGMSGKKNGQYKDGFAGRQADRSREVSRQVAAICLGHIVPKGWHIHHINEDPTDNHPENLAVFHSGSDHAHYHQQLLSLRQQGLEVDASRLVLEIGGALLPLPTRPLTLPHEIDRLGPLKKPALPTACRTGYQLTLALDAQQSESH